jgi:hypothetical protein
MSDIVLYSPSQTWAMTQESGGTGESNTSNCFREGSMYSLDTPLINRLAQPIDLSNNTSQPNDYNCVQDHEQDLTFRSTDESMDNFERPWTPPTPLLAPHGRQPSTPERPSRRSTPMTPQSRKQGCKRERREENDAYSLTPPPKVHRHHFLTERGEPLMNVMTPPYVGAGPYPLSSVSPNNFCVRSSENSTGTPNNLPRRASVRRRLHFDPNPAEDEDTQKQGNDEDPGSACYPSAVDSMNGEIVHSYLFTEWALEQGNDLQNEPLDIARRSPPCAM